MPKMNGYVKIYKNNILEDMKIKKKIIFILTFMI